MRNSYNSKSMLQFVALVYISIYQNSEPWPYVYTTNHIHKMPALVCMDYQFEIIIIHPVNNTVANAVVETV